MLNIESRRDLSYSIGLSVAELKALAGKTGGYYSPFQDKSGRKPRLIDCPIEPLSEVQKAVYRAFLRDLRYPDHLFGGIRGRSPLANASVHLGKREVLRIDIRKYFPNVTHKQVYRALVRLGCSPDVASLLTKLTTWRGRLPQGASTSMPLANLILLGTDRAILRCAAESGLTYTRYVDDLVFSGDEVRGIINPVIDLIQKAGFAVGRNKIEVMSQGGVQEVTGYRVNSKKGPVKGHLYRDRLRAQIHGLEALRSAPELFQVEVDCIRGRLQHFSQTNPQAAESLRGRLDSLVELDKVTSGSVPPKKKRRRGMPLSVWRRQFRQTV
ncbi:MAG: reverse transcriptase family protein [Acidobacteriota bacterium]|nr:reverse transcriptase family protein [Acidobacteriota bacterium]